MPHPAVKETEVPGLFGFLQRLIRSNHYEATRTREEPKITNIILGLEAWDELIRSASNDLLFDFRGTHSTEIYGVSIERESSLAPQSLVAVHKDRDGMHSILLNIVDTRLFYDPEEE